MRVGLHFNKAEHAVVPSDQIDFAPVMWSAEVLRNDAITPVPQMELASISPRRATARCAGSSLPKRRDAASSERATNLINQSMIFDQSQFSNQIPYWLLRVNAVTTVTCCGANTGPAWNAHTMRLLPSRQTSRHNQGQRLSQCPVRQLT